MNTSHPMANYRLTRSLFCFDLGIVNLALGAAGNVERLGQHRALVNMPTWSQHPPRRWCFGPQILKSVDAAWTSHAEMSGTSSDINITIGFIQTSLLMFFRLNTNLLLVNIFVNGWKLSWSNLCGVGLFYGYVIVRASLLLFTNRYHRRLMLNFAATILLIDFFLLLSAIIWCASVMS